MTTLQRSPALGPLFARALVRRRAGRELPDTRLNLTAQPIDPDRLRRYQQLCGFRVSDRLPPTFPHLLAFPLSVALMAGADFPFPLLGLLHVRNRIEQRRAVLSTETVSISAWAADLREHPAGRQVDLRAEARVADELVWSEVSTYLHRERTGAKTLRPRPELVDLTSPTIHWPVPAGIGRAYAAVSGDRNPIHLSGLTARAFGFKRAIAHGMWLAARSLAAFEGRLPEAGRFDVAFKTPLFLPATVQLQSEPLGVHWQYRVSDTRSGRPHLSGEVRSI